MKNKTPYDRFINSNDVVACAYEECMSRKDIFDDDGFIEQGAFEAAIERQVKHQFNKMAGRIEELDAEKKELVEALMRIAFEVPCCAREEAREVLDKIKANNQ